MLPSSGPSGSATDSPRPRTGQVQLSASVAKLFEPGVAAAELWGAGDTSALLPAEAACAADFSPKRSAEFAAGRSCARRALAEFGFPPIALVPNADRRPNWPAGFVGSISHTRGFCGAVVARSERFASIGFDAENVGGVSEELWPALFTPREIERLRTLPFEEQATAATVAFSAKESFYKCTFGLDPKWIEFTDVRIAFDRPLAQSGSFIVRASNRHDAITLAEAPGRYVLARGIALTGVTTAR